MVAVLPAFWWHWWAGLGAAILLILLHRANQETACNTVRALVIKDPDFYEDMLDMGVIALKVK